MDGTSTALGDGRDSPYTAAHVVLGDRPRCDAPLFAVRSPPYIMYRA